MGFDRGTITKMADKMASAYFSCCVQSNLAVFIGFFPKFHIWITSIKLSFKFEYGNEDGWQNGHHLSVFTCGHSTLVIYYMIASKFHIWITFIKLAPKFEYGLCPMIKKMATKMAATCHFALADTLTWSFFTRCLSNFIYGLLTLKYCLCPNMGFCLMNEN